MKKTITLLLVLSLFMYMNVSSIAAEGEDGQTELESESSEAVETLVETEESEESAEPEDMEKTEDTDEPEPTETETSEESEFPEESETEGESGMPEVPKTDENPSNSPLLPDAADSDASENESMAAVATYSVEIQWSNTSFEYRASSMGEWVPGTGYTGSGEPSWTPDYGTFTVTNNGDTVYVKFSFQADVSLAGLVGMKFTENASDDFDSIDPSAEMKFSIPKGQTKNLYVRPTLKSSIKAEDFTNPDNVTFGTITITIEDDPWTEPNAPEGPDIFD